MAEDFFLFIDTTSKGLLRVVRSKPSFNNAFGDNCQSASLRY